MPRLKKPTEKNVAMLLEKRTQGGQALVSFHCPHFTTCPTLFLSHPGKVQYKVRWDTAGTEDEW